MAGERNGKRGAASVSLGVLLMVADCSSKMYLIPVQSHLTSCPEVRGQKVGEQFDRSKPPCMEQGTAGLAPQQPGGGFWLCRWCRLQLSRADTLWEDKITLVRGRVFVLSLQGTNGSEQSRSIQWEGDQSDMWTRKCVLSFLQSSRI